MPAYYEAPDAYPGVAVRIWWRLFRLMVHRGLIADGAAGRLAKFLADTDAVHADGTIPEARAMLEIYAARCQVSMVTAWADLRRLVDRGLVRQVQAAAPGIRARYRLSMPLAAVREHLPDLPGDLARAMYRHVPAEDADQDERLDDEPDSGSSCGGLNTTPSPREGPPPPPAGTGPKGTNRRPGQPRRGDRGTGDSQVTGLLARCRASWISQRGADRVPGVDELAPLVPVTSRALELTGRPSDVVQLLTHQVATADDLLRTLRWRLSREIADALRTERARMTPEEEAQAEERAAEHYRAQASVRAAAIENQRTPGYSARARSVVELARRIQVEREPSFTADRRAAEEIAARAAAENARRLDRWRAETERAEENARARAEIKSLVEAGELSRAKARVQLIAQRGR